MARPKKQEPAQITTYLAIVYLRISTEMQKEGTGLDLQQRICESVCGQHGFQIVDTVQDIDYSGSLPWKERPSLEAAMEGCKAGKAHLIIAYDQGRFARSSGVDEDIRKHAKRYKYKLWSALDDNEITAESNELTADTRAFVMSLERKLIAGRFFKGRKEKAAHDGYGSGPLPFGYAKRQIGVTITGRVIWEVIEDAEKAPIVRLLLQMILDGKHYSEVAEYLNKKNLPSPYAGKKRRDGTQYPGIWADSQVYSVMKNFPLYTTGIKSWGKIEGLQRWPILLEVKEKYS